MQQQLQQQKQQREEEEEKVHTVMDAVQVSKAEGDASEYGEAESAPIDVHLGVKEGMVHSSRATEPAMRGSVHHATALQTPVMRTPSRLLLLPPPPPLRNASLTKRFLPLLLTTGLLDTCIDSHHAERTPSSSTETNTQLRQAITGRRTDHLTTTSSCLMRSVKVADPSNSRMHNFLDWPRYAHTQPPTGQTIANSRHASP
ncbi:unnamed protein product [Hydatigera taeniaeformis]|uniref:Uncharacterized protein n=1 Tax=Hydatigena taeniaeformis TaxID=6205 RepID=A0A0R3WML9_HYDTA|nr:unnamed protein product [Hydatigera taeniaeformis]